MFINIIIVLSVNLLCFIHFFNEGGLKVSKATKIFAVITFLIPIVGPLLYAVWFIWLPPAPSDIELRQNSWNHYGKTTFGTGSDYDSRKVGKYKYATKTTSKESVKENIEEHNSPNVFGKYLPHITRLIACLFGLMLMTWGATSLKNGNLTYGNPWGQGVFAPTAIATGVLIVYYALFKWRNAMK